MFLYKRNYLEGSTKEEKDIYNKLIENEERMKKGRFRRTIARSKLPKAIRMSKTIFPNNYLDDIELKNVKKIEELNEKFYRVLNITKTNERDIIKYIKENESYHIIGSILKGCRINTGHHGAFVFPEFQLGTSYKADYLLIGKSSGGYEFIFIELEKPYGNIVKNNGEFGYEINDGISQVKRWRRWLQSNYSNLYEVFRKYKNPNKNLPDEFRDFDEYRMHYVVIAGRRDDFNDMTYRMQREELRSQSIYVLHYNNLVDFSNKLVGQVTY